jgi:peptidoglycan-associated lipoprotein
MKRTLAFLLLCFAVAAAGSGCKKQDINQNQKPPADLRSIDFADEPSLRGDFDRDLNLKTIYFDYDKSDLLPDALDTLKENAAYLINNPSINVVVEGHCDERGTIEYNLSLGQRRAVKVKEYYTQLGVAANRIATISYGEEKAVDPGNNERAWAKNRRAETKVMSR